MGMIRFGFGMCNETFWNFASSALICYKECTMVRTSERSERLASIMLPHLSTICLKFLSPDKHGFVTVSGLDISGDLGIAEVKISVFGEAQEDAVAQLIKKRKIIAHEIAQVVPTRRTLAFRFLRDGAADALARIDALDV